ncbi:MAG: cytochrome c biogenesis protein CcsA [Coriobacteriales bacterium]|jgi:cytochrome c-type biogenesis protein CcmF|nr:cytochrome c biogenesis protein CcsA [Coriobacteriales bacterium]
MQAQQRKPGNASRQRKQATQAKQRKTQQRTPGDQAPDWREMSFSLIGLVGLFIALIATIMSIASLTVSAYVVRGNRQAESPTAQSLARLGHIAIFTTSLALTTCCLLLVGCFLSADNSILYVAEYRSHSESPLRWLYLLSGLWSGRSGSLLFWAWLISLFNAVVALRNRKQLERLDNTALAICQTVLLAFLGVLIYSSANMPFTATPAMFIDATGQLIGPATAWGMNVLLEHWAMAIHPPTLFIGYAGLTIPFGYALAAVIINDDSRRWVDKCQRYALVSWLFLSAGIGLGAIWAYVVLGWGGYWGWDPVENASLLSWLMSVALIHSLTVYRQRQAFKRWSVMSACLAFAFVIVGTFITRSGIVESVHAFESDPVSLVLFGILIVISILAGAVGLWLRRQSFRGQADDDSEELLTKDTAYYFNNVAMLIVTVLITYLTLASALPSPLPFAGQSLSGVSYDAIARPMGILYCLVMAACPLLAWGKADTRAFLQKAKLPALLAAGLFIILMVYFVLRLVPAYDATRAAGGSIAVTLSEAGPRWYYLALSVLGLAVASLLFFNSLVMLGRAIQAFSRSHKTSLLKSLGEMARRQSALIGGFIAHLGIALALLGLIGSSMFVSEQVGYASVDAHSNAALEDLVIGDYTLKYASYDRQTNDDQSYSEFVVYLDVYKNGRFIDKISPSIQVYVNPYTHAETVKYNAAVLSRTGEDLFVVLNDIMTVETTYAFMLDVRINPLINLVWMGFGLLLAGTTVAAVGRRGPHRQQAGANRLADAADRQQAVADQQQADAVDQQQVDAADRSQAAVADRSQAAVANQQQVALADRSQASTADQQQASSSSSDTPTDQPATQNPPGSAD